MADTGTVLWSELMTTEVEKAKSFDGEILGLSFEPFGDNNAGYWLATSDGRPIWGIMDMTERPGGPTGWFTNMAVDDAITMYALHCTQCLASQDNTHMHY